MPKRKGSLQKKSAPRKKLKQEAGAASTHTEDTQQQTAQNSVIAPPVATATPSIVQQEGKDAPVPTPVSEESAQFSSIEPPLVVEAASIGHHEGGETVEASTSDPLAPATAEDVEKKTILDPDTLMRIFYEVIIHGPSNIIPGNFGTPWHFAGYKQFIINCSGRATLRSVCKQWADLIADEINLWRDIHIDGRRIPSPPKCWREGGGPDPKNYEDPPEGEVSDLRVVDIVGEMPRAALSVERSRESPINLVLVDPTYDPDPYFLEPGRAYLPRPGMLDFLQAVMDKPMAASLSISTEDVHFVKDLLDPGVYLSERSVDKAEMEGLTDAKKISLACDGDQSDHFDLSTLPPSGADNFNGVRTRTQRLIEEANAIEHGRLRKKFKVWPKLHTLRICTRDEDFLIYDHERCALPSERAPALRHLELDLHSEHKLWLWTFPYPQLTHLTLATEEPSVILLGIISRCISLESLSITLRHHDPEVEPTLTVEPIVLSLLKKLSVQIDAASTEYRLLLDHISTPCLQSLEVITRRIYQAPPFIHLLRRSGCQLRELRLDFSSTDVDDKFNLRELLYFVAPTVESLAIQSGKIAGPWLEEFSAPNLQNVAVLCFGIEKKVSNGKKVEDIYGAAHDIALYVLQWAEKWMNGATEVEKSKRRIEFLAGPAPSMAGYTNGNDVLYGTSVYGRCESAPSPDTVRRMVSRIRAIGGNIDLRWTTVRRFTTQQKMDWFTQIQKDEPRPRGVNMMQRW
ncbi:hypothetical protein DFP72DRAFT_1150296 [Ephemerocybe angulata]|uniref:F-box domain-containing protein n=1 Tax=Ephemerocybe angulata TaxID=980116 RepID=A0A8H6LZQ6_9AGAR|nr:hypothetical protein DFP72DRAFT_1150296 [Tulosesus angulatus]